MFSHVWLLRYFGVALSAAGVLWLALSVRWTAAESAVAPWLSRPDAAAVVILVGVLMVAAARLVTVCVRIEIESKPQDRD